MSAPFWRIFKSPSPDKNAFQEIRSQHAELLWRMLQMGIIIADDHTLFREGLHRIIKSLDETTKIFQASNAAELLALIEDQQTYRVILIDLNMPGMQGIASVMEVKKKARCPVAVVSGIDDRRLIREMLRLGLDGFIPKTVKSEILLGAIRLMLAGGKYIPPDLLGDSESSLTDVGGPHITRRQLDVLQLIVRGASNREIASELELSEYTVRIHVAALLKLFAARNRTHLVAIAREKKIVFD